MKKSLLLIGTIVMSFMLSGCVKFYKDVKTEEHATFQMQTKGEGFAFNDSYYVSIYDYSKGCNDMVDLGAVSASSGSIKLPVEIPLMLKVTFNQNKGRDQYFYTTSFVLTPENRKHYVVEYEKSKKDPEGEFHVFMKNGEKAMDIPSSRIHDFNVRDCR